MFTLLLFLKSRSWLQQLHDTRGTSWVSGVVSWRWKWSHCLSWKANSNLQSHFKLDLLAIFDHPCMVGHLYNNCLPVFRSRLWSTTIEIYFYSFSSILKSFRQFFNSFLAILFIFFYFWTILWNWQKNWKELERIARKNGKNWKGLKRIEKNCKKKWKELKRIEEIVRTWKELERNGKMERNVKNCKE